MNTLLYIAWNPDVFLIHIGQGGLRWYSTCWLIGLLLGYFMMRYLYNDQGLTYQTRVVNGQKKEVNVFDPLFIYAFFGILIGARLGHCLFYQPDYFLSSGKHFIEMILPIHYMEQTGTWKFVGYEGLASHGGVVGLIIAIILYCRHYKVKTWVVIDNMAIICAITATFIRLGNLMNSEIVGKVTNVPWAFIFEQVDQYPRHPAQLYEATAYLIIFLLMFALYKKLGKKSVGTGFYFGLVLVLIFTFRFFIEYTKDIQVAFEATLPIDMGQILSLPLIAIGVWAIVRSRKAKH